MEDEQQGGKQLGTGDLKAEWVKWGALIREEHRYGRKGKVEDKITIRMSGKSQKQSHYYLF